METYEQLLKTWCEDASLMHIAHHRAASRYAGRQRWWGAIVASLSAVAASTVFIAASKGQDRVLLLVTGLFSIAAAVISAAVTSLDAGGKAQRHHAAAAAFQGLRREIEEEIVRCKAGAPKDGYEHIRKRWTAALEGSIPLPQDIHESVKREMDSAPQASRTSAPRVN